MTTFDGFISRPGVGKPRPRMSPAAAKSLSAGRDTLFRRACSSAEEHRTSNPAVPGSNPGRRITKDLETDSFSCQVRLDENAVNFVREFFEQGKPVAVICHGPWMLVEAGVIRGRTVTSWPSLQTDIRNAGGNWVDEEVHVDNGLVTSRKPADLPAFNKKMIEEFAEGKHEGQKKSVHAEAGPS
jgi:enhancing lycopene biosynthesis protein 2